MKFLVDSNILISIEPTSDELEAMAPVAAEFIALATSAGHQVVRHRAQEADWARDSNSARRRARGVLLGKYRELPRVRALPAELGALLGAPIVGSNDWVDNELIGALAASAVDFLVTEDAGIHRKAKRAGYEDRVLYAAGARDFLLTLLDRAPPAPPAVRWTAATELDETDPIFDSLRNEYPEFDAWLAMCRREARDVAVIDNDGGGLAALAILVRKADKFATEGSWLKIGTFKVADEHRGRRYGELLLKAIFGYRLENRFDFSYVTVFDRHDGLVRLFVDFGFTRHVDRSPAGEAILTKRFTPQPEDRGALAPLEYHVTFGPPAISVVEAQVFVVPVLPKYHQLLFPDAEQQLGLPGIRSDRPIGNGLRKAYLCHAPLKSIGVGATLLFYRSHDVKGITCVGVVEDVTQESTANEIARLVGSRTVYTYNEIELMARKPVLVIRFRQDRLVDPPIRLAEMLNRQLLSGHPQTVTRVKKEGVRWLLNRINA